MKLAVETIDEQYATLSREQIARALGVNLRTLDSMHRRGDAPPRFKVSPQRWCYPAVEFRKWQQKRLAEAKAEASAA